MSPDAIPIKAKGRRGNRKRTFDPNWIPKMTQLQIDLLLCYVSVGTNPETGESNEAVWWQNENAGTHRGLWRRNLLQIVQERTEPTQHRYDITGEGRRVAALLIAAKKGANA